VLNDSSNPASAPAPFIVDATPRVSVIIPARNEEVAITACIESLVLQPEIAEIIVVDDQSTDKTHEIVSGLAVKYAKLRLISTDGLPAGWVGKNHAVALGASAARFPWLLFTDADAEHEPESAARGLLVAQQIGAVLVSFSPEQVTRAWYEKALIPFIYCRLARLFSFDDVNNPNSPAAAANGQFLMITRAAYEAIGGHASVAAEVLEDVALAKRAKISGQRIWFASGKGIVRVRMYRSFSAMWQGWKKNLYRLVGGTPWRAFREFENAAPWIPVALFLIGLKLPLAMFLAVLFLIFRQMNYGSELTRNQYPFSLILYYIPGALLYSGVLWASYRSHARGIVEWKGREYPVEVAGTSK
jgi:glycosyltransferase involved in cell wall biosynthesis